ncbi:B-cell receptor CD22 isoform X2 [Sturnira hondurensis]|uniref:B-cell receptor CD22 isoform X2 n=1 Tax=Sturnira hondurensis TaxID=192404 RepID=UPI0018793E0B|nr:B-cell receptor CD22 isoform X2 [Sturnira hondurensis]
MPLSHPQSHRKIGGVAKEGENQSPETFLCFPFYSQMLPGSLKREDTRKQAPPRHNTMHLLIPLLLFLEYLAFSDSENWNFEHPKTLYAWEGTCIWIPCLYTVPKKGKFLDNLIVYQNYEWDGKTSSFNGTVLYDEKKSGTSASRGRVQFLGDKKSNCTLHINPVNAQDNGQLGLRMTLEDYKWMEAIVLNISKTAPPPRIYLPPGIRELQEVTLTCQLDFACPGYQTKLQWSLEGTQHNLSPVSSTVLNTKTVSTQSQLKFQPEWTNHGKKLTCQLWKDSADGLLSQETVQLDVKHSPKLQITFSHGEAVVKEGNSVNMTSLGEAIVKERDSVTMKCQVISSNPQYDSIHWFKDGNLLSEHETQNLEQKTVTLSLPSVTKQMTGNYHYAPEPSTVRITVSPAKEGSKISLTCISQAYPPPIHYTWYHNKIEIPRTDKTFQIPEVSLEHAGNYSCLAKNSVGTGETGQAAELDVQYSPKEVTMAIQNPTPIREGDSVTLFCNYTSSNPSVTRYEWRPQGSWKEIMPGVLMIQKVPWNASPFSCAACNQWCSWTSPVNLHVQYAPRGIKVLLISPGSEIHSGHPVLLRCNFSSSYPTDVLFFWKKNGIFLKEGRDLSFDSISPEDAGNYNCLVNNSIGQSTSEAWMLRVLYAPRRLRVSISPEDSVMEGKKVVLTCESDANPPISQYTWFDWNNQNLHHDDQMLRLDPVKVEHSGAYWCQGANRLGMDQSPPRKLTVYYSPETISKQVALAMGLFLVILLLPFLGVKLQRRWKRIQSQQGLQENSSAQSFFVRNRKVRRAPHSEGPHSLGCYNPAMEEPISYATLRFPMAETDTPRIGEAGTSELPRTSLNRDNTVTYSVVQKRQVGDYENVTPDVPEDEGIHYSELVHLGTGERPLSQEGVEYVTLKH